MSAASTAILSSLRSGGPSRHLLSRSHFLLARKKIPGQSTHDYIHYCSRISLSSCSFYTRRLSSVRPLVDDDDDDDDNDWTAPAPSIARASSQAAQSSSPSPLAHYSQHNNKNDKKSGDKDKDEIMSHSLLSHGRTGRSRRTRKGSPPLELVFTGNHCIPITSTLRIVTPSQDTPRGTWPIFRLMDEDGCFREADDDHEHDGSTMGTQRLNQDDSTAAGQGHGLSSPAAAARQSSSSSPSGENVQDAAAAAAAAAATTTLDDDLNALKGRLQQDYPHLTDIYQSCALLDYARHDYLDVAAFSSSKDQQQQQQQQQHATDNTLLRAYTHMIRLREMDVILQNAQRQGRISFYMTCRGEEAIHIGAASALSSATDVVLAQYREAGLLMWRGFTLEQFANQCFSNDLDLGKGRQMPVHYGSRALNYHTISSPLGTQLPQAVGVAYHAKLMGDDNESNKPSGVTACFFGDGCASTTDFHSACNFAATLQVPLLFICRNNGYAISTSVEEQYAGDGIVSRAPGYGMAGIRVDGNDLFAVHVAIAACRDYALTYSAPVLIELMTYRQGHHSTSDDSTRYRSLEEVHGHQHYGDPVKRMEAFLKHYGIVDESWMVSLRDEEKLAVLRAMEGAERRPKPNLDEMFQDVYEQAPPHLERQEAELRAHIAKYPQRYEES